MLFRSLLLLCAALTILSACNESEPLPEGVSSLPDVGTESFVNSETGEIEWPAELLPDNFPKAKYEEIYSVERIDNEVIIVLFATSYETARKHKKREKKRKNSDRVFHKISFLSYKYKSLNTSYYIISLHLKKVKYVTQTFH